VKGKIAARFGFRPEGSQVLVVLFGFMSGICALCAIGFVAFGIPSALPIALFAIFGVVAVVGWWLSYRSIDYRNSVPTTLSISGAESGLTTDSRNLSDPKALQTLSKMLAIVSERQPLPMPAGMVNPDGSPDLMRVNEAVSQAQAINQDVSRRSHEAVLALGTVKPAPGVPQPQLTVDPGDVIEGVNVAVCDKAAPKTD
jgi:hypothetical protein